MLCLSTGSLFTRPIAQVFAWAAEAGFDGVELLVDDRRETRDREHVQRCMRETGLPVPVVHVPFHSQATPEWGADSVERVLATARLAKSLGAELVVVHLPLWHERRFTRWLQEDLPQAERELAVTLAVENLPAKRWLIPGVRLGAWPFNFREPAGDTLWGRALRAVSQPRMRFNTVEELAEFKHVVFDATHWARRGDVFGFWESLRGMVSHVHLSNCSRRGGHRLLWDGDIDMERFVRTVRAEGYKGHLTAELCPAALGDPCEDSVRARLAETLRWLRSVDRP
ncbi:MAG: sugar phosphate isomerase/epimerase [Planctomycetes bacterium]|nr:sugar phosphate isomerase/epimerase [Planctomycetota bacterium]